MMSDNAKSAVSAWLGQSGQCNSRLEALYQAVEDCDMVVIRTMMEALWQAGHDAALPPLAHVGYPRSWDVIGGMDE